MLGRVLICGGATSKLGRVRICGGAHLRTVGGTPGTSPVETPILLLQIKGLDHVIVHVAHLHAMRGAISMQSEALRIEALDHVIIHVAHHGLLRLVAVPSHDCLVPCLVQWPMHLDPLAHQRVATKP